MRSKSVGISFFHSLNLIILFFSCRPAAPLLQAAGAPRLPNQKAIVCPDGPTVPGIDVSYWQGDIDWDAVAASGVVFAFIRAADGFFEDPKFEFNWAEARRVGIIRGTYQYFRPGLDAVRQAQLILRKIGTLQPDDLPPVLDVETTDGFDSATITAGIRQWVRTIQAATGKPPLIYTAKYFWQDNVGTVEFSELPLWVAHWGVDCPNLPRQWSSWVFWQTSSNGKVPGIKGRVDTDLFNGDIEKLLQFAKGPAACEKIPPEGRIVDQDEPCFERHGTPAYWHSEKEGWGGSLLWTYAWEAREPDNYGIWHLEFLEQGQYRIEVYIAAGWGQSRNTVYRVKHAGGVAEIALNQNAGSGWRPLGVFRFLTGPDQWVRLDDNTGEPLSAHRRIVFDALRVRRAEPPPVYVFTGDANCNGGVDIADAVCSLGYLFGSIEDPCSKPCCLANLDTTNDGQIDIADTVAILRFLFKGAPMNAPDGSLIRNSALGCSAYPPEFVPLPCKSPCGR